MNDEERWKQAAATTAFAMLLGLPGCGMALGDLGKGRTILDWVILGAFYYLFIGFLLGLTDRRNWLLSIFSAWGPACVALVMGIFNVGHTQNLSLTLLSSVFFAGLGGFLGAKIWSRLGAS